MSAKDVNELLDACRRATARILATKTDMRDVLASEAITIAHAFDVLDTLVQQTGILPDAWHPSLRTQAWARRPERE